MKELSNEMLGDTELDKTKEILDVWQIRRRDRIRFIMKWLKEKGKVSLDEFSGFVGVELGTHRDTAQEYLRDIELYGKVKTENGWILWVDSKENETQEKDEVG